MATTINADTSNGLKITSDTSGVIEFQSAGTTKAGVNSTGLTGDGSQLTGISSVPERLVKSMPLTSGKTVTSGKMVSIISNGEVGTLPSVNTLGTYRATSNTFIYGGYSTVYQASIGPSGISHNGTRGISLSGIAAEYAAQKVYSGSQTSRVVTCTGHAFSDSATTVNGSTTVTIPIPNRLGPSSQDSATGYGGGWDVYTYPVSDTSFMVISRSSGFAGGTYGFDWNGCIVTVDSSGNVTKGTVVNSQVTTTSTPPGWMTFRRQAQSRLSNNTVAIAIHDYDDNYLGLEPTYNCSRVFKWTGGTGVAVYKSNFSSLLAQINFDAVYPGSVRTSGGKIVWWQTNGLKIYQLAISDADGGLGATSAVTEVLMTAIPVTSPGTAFVGDQWYGSFRKPTDETKLYIQGYNFGGDNFRVMIPVAISSAGVPANNIGTYSTGNTDNDVNYPEFHTINFPSDGTNAMAGIRSIGGAMFVNTFSTNAAGRITGSNLGNEVTGSLPDTDGAIRWNGSKWMIFTRESNVVSANQVTVDLTVGAQATDAINFVGFPVATDSSTPTDVIVQGVADGFSSLTPGSTYFQSGANDGSVTLSNASGVKVGKAISSTEMLLNRTL